MFHAQMSERMKVVDVLSTRVYSDSQQIIAQVNNVFVQSAFIGLFFLNSTCFCAPLQLLCCFLSQGDLADCFYIVESGQVRITMKRSRVSLHRHPLDKPLIKKKISGNLEYAFLFLCQTKTDQEEEEVDIATCSRGQYFGELALVTNKPRAASAYAVGSVKCLGKFCAVLCSFVHISRQRCTSPSKTHIILYHPFQIHLQVLTVSVFFFISHGCSSL